jgi:hypothetical protein
MQIMHGYHALVKVFAAVTAIALLTASPVAAQIVGNTPCPTTGAGCFNGAGKPWQAVAPSSGEQGAASIPDLSGIWARISFPGFEPPL